MSGFGQRFVVDTNTLSQIGKRRRASAFFLNNVVIPEEVLHEAGASADIGTLENLIYPTTADVLNHLVRIMATVAIEDNSLVNLYSNKGSADPLLVACALDAQGRDSDLLYAPEWIVVTNDEAVRIKAEQFALKSLTNVEFAALIDESEASAHAVKSDEA